jgi:hypothetical protein
MALDHYAGMPAPGSGIHCFERRHWGEEKNVTPYLLHVTADSLSNAYTTGGQSARGIATDRLHGQGRHALRTCTLDDAPVQHLNQSDGAPVDFLTPQLIRTVSIGKTA